MTTYDADVLWPLCDSAHPHDAATLSSYHYDDGQQFVQAKRGGGDVVRDGDSLRAEPAVFAPWSVAANGGKALTRYDPDFAPGQLTPGGRASAS
jgi:hypothetical protein